MSVTRVAVVLFALAGIGLSLVQLRGRRTQHVHEMQQLRAQQLRGQQALWALQLETTRLGAPARIRERAKRLGLAVIPPQQAEDAQRGGAVVVRRPGAR